VSHPPLRLAHPGPATRPRYWRYGSPVVRTGQQGIGKLRLAGEQHLLRDSDQLAVLLISGAALGRPAPCGTLTWLMIMDFQ